MWYNIRADKLNRKIPDYLNLLLKNCTTYAII